MDYSLLLLTSVLSINSSAAYGLDDLLSSSEIESCRAGDSAMDSFLLRHTEWYPYEPDFLQHLRNTVGPPEYILDNDIMCFIAYSMKQQAGTTTKDLEWVNHYGYGFFRILYGSVVMYLKYTRYSAMAELDNPKEGSDLKILRLKVDLISHIEASGVMRHIPEAPLLMNALRESPVPESYVPEPPADIRPFFKCKRIAKALTKLWNTWMRRMDQTDPGSSEYLRQHVKNWTGLDIPHRPDTHRYIRAKTCHVIKSDDHDGIPIYTHLHWFRYGETQMLKHVVNAGYPYFVKSIERIEHALEDNVTGDDSTTDGGSDLVALSMMADDLRGLLSVIIRSIRRMGLLDLQQVTSDEILNTE